MPSPVASAPAVIVSRVGPYARLNLPVRGLATLADNDRVTVSHLAAAAAAGKRIAWEQSHAESLAIADLLAGVVSAPTTDAPIRERLRAYLAAFELSLGPYDARSGAKLPLGLTAVELGEALVDAHVSGGALPDTLPTPMSKFLFDATEKPYRSAAMAGGTDPFAAIGVNFYEGVSVAALATFEERHPRNARIVGRDGRLTEQVWCAGREAADGQRPSPKGHGADTLRAVATEIRLAKATAAPDLVAYLDAVLDLLETGEPDSVVRSDDLWVGQSPPVAASFGFVETDWDPRAKKGLWQALVVIDDSLLRARFAAIAEGANAIEARAPWGAAYRRDLADPTLPWPVEAVAGSGATGPILPAEITLPNEVVGRDIEPRTWLLGNVVRAVDSAMDELTLDAFASAADRRSARRYRDVISDLQMALDWIVGRPPCRPSRALAGKDPSIALKELATPLEFLKRSLVGLHFLPDPVVRASAPDCDDACVETAYRRLVRHETILLGRTRTARIEDEHHRALRTLVAWLSDQGAVRVDLPAAGDDSTPIAYEVDADGARRGVATLLAETVRIISEGDYVAARTLFELSELPDEDLMAPLRRRIDALDLPDAYSFVAPSLEAR